VLLLSCNLLMAKLLLLLLLLLLLIPSPDRATSHTQGNVEGRFFFDVVVRDCSIILEWSSTRS